MQVPCLNYDLIIIFSTDKLNWIESIDVSNIINELWTIGKSKDVNVNKQFRFEQIMPIGLLAKKSDSYSIFDKNVGNWVNIIFHQFHI